jgi:hypothetical protein
VATTRRAKKASTSLSAQQEEQFAREAKLASTEKGEAMIAEAVTWTAGLLRRMIAEA